MRKDIDIVVLGSINIDLIIETERNPYPGETIRSKTFHTSPGGKGDNQAVAIARLGGKVTFVGCVGRDPYGEQLVNNLIEKNVIADHIKRLDGVGTGMAFINVFKGQNTIILYEGANGQCTVEQVRYCEDLIKRARILLMQLEIPVETVMWASEVAKASNTLVVLNPAPAAMLDDKLYSNVDILVPNEVEAQQLSGIEIKEDDDYEKIMAIFTDKGIKNIIITAGDKGVFYNFNDEIKRIPAYKVEVIDSTGAGDAFIGGLCYSLACGMDVNEATNYANAVAAISVTRLGAQSALPTAQEVQEFLKH